MKTFLVTGGSGFIGSAIANYLVNTGAKVVVFDNNSRGKLYRIKNKKIIFIKGDIRNKRDLAKAFYKYKRYKIFLQKTCRNSRSRY